MRVGDKVRIKSWDELVKEFGLDEQNSNKINNKVLGMFLNKKLYKAILEDGEIQNIAKIDDVYYVLNNSTYGFGVNKNMLKELKENK